MPTPFQHLIYAERVLTHPGLPATVREALQRDLGAFLLGTTAADVQVITGQPRHETHFYRLSTGRDGSPVAKMLATFPSMPPSRSPAHAAFLAGYAVHLVWDEIWAWDVFVPYYRDAGHWAERKALFVHHNALRVWLDRQANAGLQAWSDLPASLGGVVPEGWLPFAPDWALGRWRDWLASQLADPGSVQTAAVFAERLEVPVDTLLALVDEMVAGRYHEVPGLTEAVAAYEAAALKESVDLLCGPLWAADGTLGSPVRSSELRDPDTASMLGVASS